MFLRFLHRNCDKLCHSNVLVNRYCNKVFEKRGSKVLTCGLPGIIIFEGHLVSLLPISTVMDATTLCSSNEDCIAKAVEPALPYVNESSVSRQVQEDEESKSRSYSSKSDAKTADITSKDPGLSPEKCDVDTSQSDSDYIGLDMLFDVAKIVDNVKMKVREKRQERRKKTTGSLSNHSESEFLDLQSLFDEANLSNVNKYKEESRKRRNSERFSSANEFDSDSFDLELLFQERKSVNKGKVKAKKARKIKKHLAAKKITQNDSLGLELLFSDRNLVNEDRLKKRRKRKMVATELDENDEDGTGAVIKDKPNHFVAIRVSNAKIHSSVKDFQASLLKENAKIKPALIPLSSLHITMAVMHLDESSTEIARSALEKCKVKILPILNGVDLKLKFVGVGNFKHEVVFAKVEKGRNLESLNSVYEIITATFEEEGICVSRDKEWKPHLTLLKLSRKPALRRKGIRKVNDDNYASWMDFYFGEELVENLYLCSMFEQKEKDGFYKCVADILLKIDEEVRKPGRDVFNATVTPAPDANYD